jgi:hypothetical protein
MAAEALPAHTPTADEIGCEQLVAALYIAELLAR